jgi:predicted metal-dependent phosphoesterase TrpH
MEQLVDLHLHTVYSDGQWQPDQLFSYLAAEGFTAVSITDHDTVAHQEELLQLGAAAGITVIAGVEVTSRWQGMIAHILCYAKAFTASGLAHLVEETTHDLLENTQAVYAELERRSFRFPRRDEVLADQQGQVLRPIDNVRLLVSHGYAIDLETGLQMIISAGYRIAAAPLPRVVEVAHQSGAVALLAHPGRGGGEITRYGPELLEETLLPAVPLDGIEVYYPSHSPEQTEALLALANRRGLLISAGSDSHGPMSRPPVRYPGRYCTRLLARCGVSSTIC